MSAQKGKKPQRHARLAIIIAWICLGLFLPTAAQASSVWVVPIKGTIEWGLAGFVRRAVKEAADGRADALLFEINTFGGRVDAATEVRDIIFASQIPIITFVTERAWSAGALIAMAGEKLIMAPSATIGAAEPRPADEKTISAVRAEFEATAQTRGRDPILAAAMVDQDVGIEGVIKAGKILTLSAEQALQHGFADAVANSRSDALGKLGFADQEFHIMHPTFAEKVAGFVTQPVVSSLLLSLGFAGLVLELLTPGFGIPGTVGVVSLVLFFGGRLVTGLAGWEVAMLFLTGFILLLVEALIIPGFGLAGILGLGGIFGSILLSYASTEAGLLSLTVALVVTILVVVLGWKYFRRSQAWQRLVLHTVVEKAPNEEAKAFDSPLIGKIGDALTPLRPAGIVDIEGERVDAVTEGGFLAKGTGIKVVEVLGNRVVVRAILSDVSED
ncbi:MAG: nodulation protein NfeD [Firmicutes bacterium]|nr:nodulation protein NfeD [Bacillota bacterium]